MTNKRKPQSPHSVLKVKTSIGNDTHFSRIFESMYYHPSYRNLTGNAKDLLTGMILESLGQSSFYFPHSVYMKVFNSRSSFKRALNELIKYGFVEYIPQMQRKKAMYRISDGWKKYDDSS